MRKWESCTFLLFYMELTILTRFQFDESMLKALSRVNTIFPVLTYASSHLQRVRATVLHKSCRNVTCADVGSERSICFQRRRNRPSFKPSGTTSTACRKSSLKIGKCHVRPARTFSTLCRRTSMKYFHRLCPGYSKGVQKRVIVQCVVSLLFLAMQRTQGAIVKCETRR